MGAVYLLHDSGRNLYRLGRTKCLRSRILTHYSERVGDMRLVWFILTNGAERLERLIQQRWSAQHVGSEWFDATDEQVKQFRSFKTVMWHDGCDLPERQRNQLSRKLGAKPKYLIRVGEIIRPLIVT